MAGEADKSVVGHGVVDLAQACHTPGHAGRPAVKLKTVGHPAEKNCSAVSISRRGEGRGLGKRGGEGDASAERCHKDIPSAALMSNLRTDKHRQATLNQVSLPQSNVKPITRVNGKQEERNVTSVQEMQRLLSSLQLSCQRPFQVLM